MYYKIFTHDWRPPLRGGERVTDGESFPVELPAVRLDTSDAECAAGWNFVDDLSHGLVVAGLWRNGRPRVACEVSPSTDFIRRGNKLRCSQLTLMRQLPEDEVNEGIDGFSSKHFGEHAAEMTVEQIAWRKAMGRPNRDELNVEIGLREALEARGLAWKLKKLESARDAWDARDAWAARAAWAAWAALTIYFVSLSGWVETKKDALTVGIRDAYKNGLGVALPMPHGFLGWAMEEKV